MKTVAMFCLAIILVAGFPQAQEAPPVEEVTGAEDLVEKKGSFQGTRVHPDADITRYSKLYLWQAVFQFREEGGPETLLVRATVTDIVTDIASKSGKSGKDPKPFSVQGDFAFDLIDAETGVLLARVGENRKSRKAGESVTPPETGPEWVNIWVWAEQAAADLRQELERVLSEDRG